MKCEPTHNHDRKTVVGLDTDLTSAGVAGEEGGAEGDGDLPCSEEHWNALGTCDSNSNKKRRGHYVSYLPITVITHLSRINPREERCVLAHDWKGHHPLWWA